MKQIGTLIAVVILLLTLRSCMGCGEEDTPKDPKEAAKSWAPVICRNYVKQQLAFPEESDFGYDIQTTTFGDFGYKCIGYVTSKNAFGVKVKFLYSCSVVYNGIGDIKDYGSWQLYDIQMNANPSPS